MSSSLFKIAFVIVAFLSLALGTSTSASQSFDHTTISPSGAQIVQGAWTVTVPLPSTTTLGVDILTKFNEVDPVVLVGPTTLVTVISIHPIRSYGQSSTIVQGSGNITGTTSSLPSARMPLSHLATAPRTSGGLFVNSSSATNPQKITTTPVPVMGLDPDSAMAAEYANANFTYTMPPYKPVNISTDECVLWDRSCQGNKTLAATDFFNRTADKLLQDNCFMIGMMDPSSPNCTSSLVDPASSSMMVAAKSWMRQPACASSWSSWASIYYPVMTATTTFATQTGQFIDWPWGEKTFADGNAGATTITASGAALNMDERCCGRCNIYGPNVDVFYWPHPNADDSCLDVIGSSVAPLTEGAQTDNHGVLYWADSTDPYDIYVPTKTTARITTVNGITIKEAVVNPWGTNTITTTRPLPSKRSPLNVHARARDIIRDLGMSNKPAARGTGAPSGNVSTAEASIAVSDGFSFTSPSVYVAFYSLSATDACGTRGQPISSTMLAFDPEELSTVQGHYYARAPQPTDTKRFNFADLPCPPMSVMMENWYKPAPGEPYRPLLALPAKVRGLDPLWSTCTNAFWFTGLDPPRTLTTNRVGMAAPSTPTADPGTPANPAQQVPPLPPNTGLKMAPDPTTLAPNDPAKTGSDDPGSRPDQNKPVQALFSSQAAVAEPNNPDQNKPVQALSSQAAVVKPNNQDQTNPPQKNSPLGSPTQITSPANSNPPNHQGQNDQPQMNPSAPNVAAEATKNNIPATLQFGSGSNQVNPNNLAPAQLSGLHATLTPAASPGPDAGNPSSPGANSQPQANGGNAGNQVQPVAAGAGSQSQGGRPQGSPNQASEGSSALVPMGPASIALGSITYPLPQVTAKPAGYGGDSAATVIIASHTVIAGPGGYQVDGQKVEPHGGPMTIAGTPVRINAPDGGNHLGAGKNAGKGYTAADGDSPATGSNPANENNPAIPGGTLNLPPAESAPITTIANQAIVNKGGFFQIDNTRITPGAAPVTISGTPWSMSPQEGSNSPMLNVAGKVYDLPSATKPPVTTIAGQAVQALGPDVISIGGTTLTQGGPAITISSSILIIFGSSLVIGSSTISLGFQNAPTPTTSNIDIGGLIFTALNGGFANGGTTIIPGAPAVSISGTAYSLPPSGLSLNGGATTSAVATAPSQSPITTVLTVAGQVMTADASGVRIGSATVPAGGSGITIGGTLVSLDASGGLHVGSSTVPLVSTAPTNTIDAGAKSTGGNGTSSVVPSASTAPTSAIGGGAKSTGDNGTPKGGSQRRAVPIFVVIFVTCVASLLLLM